MRTPSQFEFRGYLRNERFSNPTTESYREAEPIPLSSRQEVWKSVTYWGFFSRFNPYMRWCSPTVYRGIIPAEPRRTWPRWVKQYGRWCRVAKEIPRGLDARVELHRIEVRHVPVNCTVFLRTTGTGEQPLIQTAKSGPLQHRRQNDFHTLCGEPFDFYLGRSIRTWGKPTCPACCAKGVWFIPLVVEWVHRPTTQRRHGRGVKQPTTLTVYEMAQEGLEWRPPRKSPPPVDPADTEDPTEDWLVRTGALRVRHPSVPGAFRSMGL